MHFEILDTDYKYMNYYLNKIRLCKLICYSKKEKITKKNEGRKRGIPTLFFHNRLYMFIAVIISKPEGYLFKITHSR